MSFDAGFKEREHRRLREIVHNGQISFLSYILNNKPIPTKTMVSRWAIQEDYDYSTAKERYFKKMLDAGFIVENDGSLHLTEDGKAYLKKHADKKQRFEAAHGSKPNPSQIPPEIPKANEELDLSSETPFTNYARKKQIEKAREEFKKLAK